MTDLPTAQTLAKIVDETAQAMYGVAVSFAGDCATPLPPCSAGSPTIIVPLIGQPLYLITAHAEQTAGVSLASALFSCPAADISDDMVEDSLRELCGILAGQLQHRLAPEHELGLTSRLTDGDTLKGATRSSGAHIRFGQAAAPVSIAVAELAGLG